MPVLLAFVSLVPLLFLAGAARRGPLRGAWAQVGILYCLGLFVTHPFLTERQIGAGDAANYAHAVADTALQLRAGVFPVFVGQSDFAFNGRVHPLRTAPYFTYSAGLLDFATAHRLNFWGLQNGILALSLMASFFTAYACLRRLGPTAPWFATGLAAAYGLCPALLACAYGQDLYMTVTAAPFIPVALLGAIRGFTDRSLGNYGLMALGVGALWLAHPPVAAWVLLGCGGLTLVSWLTRRPSGSAAAALGLAAVLAGVLTIYVFVSALSLNDTALSSAPAFLKHQAVDTLAGVVHEHWQGELAPVGDNPAGLNAFQLGYVLWLLLGAALLAAWRRGALGWTLAALLLGHLLLLLPVPGLFRAAWLALPFQFITLTNIWPMQRGYLVLAGWTVFAAASILPAVPWGQWRRYGPTGIACLVLAVLWTVGQAWLFAQRGGYTQRTAETTALLHRPENANLTVTAYALLRPPSTFTHGTMDPEHEFRLIRAGDGQPLGDNWDPATRRAVTAQGHLHISGGDKNGLDLSPDLLLAPGRHYVLRFHFLTAPFGAALLVVGGTLQREYRLPSYVGIHGFGMEPGNNPALVLWTTGDQPSSVHLRLASSDPKLPLKGDLADFTLEEVDRAKLPIQLESLVPQLACRVQAPEDAWLVTPRMFIRGYAATVDGGPGRVIESDEGMVLVAVPKGVHQVVLRYAGFPALRAAFFTTLLGWSAVLGLSAWGWFSPGRVNALARRLLARRVRVRSPSTRVLGFGLGAAVLAGLFLWALPAWRHRAQPTAGPVKLQFWLPIAHMGETHHLIKAGAAPDNSVVFVKYTDWKHIQLGLDAGHKGYAISPPIEVAYSQLQTLVVTTGSLYPVNDPALAGRSPAELDWLRGTLRLWLNGREILIRRISDYYATPTPLQIASAGNGGANVIGGFTGTVLRSERLPIADAGCPLGDATEAVRAGAGPIRLRLALPPDRPGQSEPVLTLGVKGGGTFVFLQYLDSAHLRVGLEIWGLPPTYSPPLEVDYREPQELTVSAGALYPAAAPAVAALPPEERDWLHSHVRIQFNGRPLIARHGPSVPIPPSQILFGQETSNSSFMTPVFNGVVLGMERRPLAESGYLPAAADQGPATGPLKITVLLPMNRFGRAEPLVTTGIAGNAMFLFLHYVDATHAWIGLDLWGQGIGGSGQPFTADFTQPQEFIVSAGALYPSGSPLLASLSAAELKELRGKIVVTLNHQVVFTKAAVAAEAKPATVTVGENRIGGSSAEADFTGDVLAYERLPVAAGLAVVRQK